jgi:hypothetical protein
MMITEATIIYVDVIGSRERHLMPADAICVHDSCYRLLHSSPDQEHFPWAFAKGDIVRCEPMTFAPGEAGLRAVELCAEGVRPVD